MGKSPSPPSKVEQGLYTVTTNVYNVTNVVAVPVTNTVTQVVTQTNAVGVPVFQTNVVTTLATVYTTNVVQKQDYNLSTSPQTTQLVQGVAGAVNTFAPGMGTIAGYALLALIGGWGYLRGSKRQDTSIALSQEIEALREFIKSLPQGAKFDEAITAWLQQHQVDAGVTDQVLALLKSEVSNPDAQAALKEIQTALTAMAKP